MTAVTEHPRPVALPEDAKMTITLEVSPDLAIRLTNVAARHGIPLRDYVNCLLEKAASEEIPAPPPSTHVPGEVAARGKEWYERDIRHKVNTPENKGKALVINVENGEYEMDADGNLALDRARAKHPDALFLRMRIGYRAYGKMGGSWRSMEE